ncbi:methyltransferase domain-containing protein [Candidatus Kaiserbacteria bacterium]|nr:methyltransferase domain-containing protein [Candidatus Kaiserbacteria bacterium]
MESDGVSQEDINERWGGFWKTNLKRTPSGHVLHTGLDKPDPYFWLRLRDTPERQKDFFWHRMFLEGYPVFKRYLPLRPGQKILEIGGGSGRHGFKIAHDFPGSAVTITDIVDDSLLLMRRMRDELTIDVDIRKEDVLHLSFPDNTFDVVFCDAVIQLLSEYPRALAEMARVAKPGGRIIVSAVNWWNLPLTLTKYLEGKSYSHGYEKSFTRRELQKTCAAAGLRVVAEDGFYFAYGIHRLKSISRLFKLLGYLVNCLVHLIDPLTGRFISRHFGFYIFVVAEK